MTCTFMIFRNIDYRANSLNHSQTLRQVTTAYYTVTGGTSLVCRCPTNTRVHEQVLRLVVSLNDQQYEGLGLPAAVHQPVKLYATTPLSGKKPSVDFFDRNRASCLTTFVEGPADRYANDIFSVCRLDCGL